MCVRVCEILNFIFVACRGNNSRPSLSLNLQPEKEVDGRYRLTLEWSVEYNIDFLESLDFFRIAVTGESNFQLLFEQRTVQSHDTVCCITSTCIFIYILLFRAP